MVTILSGKLNKVLLFFFATLAQNIMNAVSVGIGSIFPLFLPQWVISIIVIALFTGFGLKLLWNVAFYKEKDNAEEEELKEQLEKIENAEDMTEPLLSQSPG